MKKFMLPIILVILSASLRSQTANFNLSDYKLPVLKRKYLETNFSLSGTNRNSTLLPPYNFNSSSSQYSGNFSLYYSSYLNTPTRQKLTTGQLFLDGSYQREKEDNLTKKNRIFSPAVNLKTENRWYKGKKFIELDYHLAYSSSNSKANEEFESESNYLGVFASIPIKAGFGRIEQIQDARHAIYIMDELALAGKAFIR
jgi:hypothetical protein